MFPSCFAFLQCLEYEDGSVVSFYYFAVGSKELPKEWLEVHFDEKSIIVDDYQTPLEYRLPEALEAIFVEELKVYEKEKNMP